MKIKEEKTMNIDGHTKMYCLIGSPVGHSGSPAMYNYSFDRLGINSAYLAYDVPLEKTGEAVAALRLLAAAASTSPCPARPRSRSTSTA